MNANEFDPTTEPSSTPGSPGTPAGANPGRPVLPPAPPVPDDRIHGDDLPGNEPFGASWLRPTLTATADPAQRATDPAPARPTPSAPMSSPPTKSWLIAGLGATLLLAAAASFSSWNALTGGLWRSADQSQSYTQSISNITFEGSSGDVEIRADSASGKVEVSRHLSWGPGSTQPTPDESVTGSTLTIASNCSAFMSWCSIDYIVHVPTGTTVNLNSGSGDVVLAGDLGSITAETGSGDISVEGSGTGPVSLKAGSGDIAASDLVSGQVLGRTGSGSMDLDFAQTPTDVTLDAGSGDVSVLVPQGIYAVTGDSGSGDREVGVSLSSTSTNKIEIRTGSGDVNVSYR
ncbi:DUF4097 family beta strand repeat-containing protein [Monashia sp. NPDC004114]